MIKVHKSSLAPCPSKLLSRLKLDCYIWLPDFDDMYKGGNWEGKRNITERRFWRLCAGHLPIH